MNIKKLKGKMLEKDVTIPMLAETLNINITTVYRKFKGNGEGFTIGEVNKIVSELGLTSEDAQEIFFAEDVA